MINPFDWRYRVKSLIERGCEIDTIMHVTDDESVESALNYLKFAAKNDPEFLLKEILAMSGSKMTPLVMAALYSCAASNFLSNEEHKSEMFKIMFDKRPAQLLEMTEMLKTKYFGRGFGSRPQKMVRKIMETWDSVTLEGFAISQPKQLYSLVRLIHPRYKGYRGEIIKLLIRGEFTDK